MKVTQHGQNLYKLTRLIAFNSYIVRENDGLTVVDTNLPGSAKGIIKAAQQIGQPIRRIVLTHSHSDHIASVDGLKAALPDVEVLISAREARFLRGDMTLDKDEPQDQLRGGYQTIQTQPTEELQAGDRIGSLEVIAAPGHTPGHIAFYDTRDGSLLGGDAFQVQGGFGVSGMFAWLFPFPAWATWHKASALHTAKVLRDLNPSRLAVGHGRIIENPVQQMTEGIEKATSTWNVSKGQMATQ